MQNVRFVISLILITSGVIVGAQYQVLDVCIQVKSDQSFRKGSIPSNELEKYGRFGMREAPPFAQYFRVSSVPYDDYLDQNQLVEIKKNLIKHVPLMIEKDIRLSCSDNALTVLKQYKFPKFLPKTFIEKVENCEKEARPFQHVIYKSKNSGNTKSLALRYWIGFIGNRKKLPKPLAIVPQHEVALENNSKESLFASDYVMELLDLLTLCMWMTPK